ncbi:MAG: hypothetical protein ACRDF8_02555 [Chloroflexota bacterium]
MNGFEFDDLANLGANETQDAQGQPSQSSQPEQPADGRGEILGVIVAMRDANLLDERAARALIWYADHGLAWARFNDRTGVGEVWYRGDWRDAGLFREWAGEEGGGDNDYRRRWGPAGR